MVVIAGRGAAAVGGFVSVSVSGSVSVSVSVSVSASLGFASDAMPALAVVDDVVAVVDDVAVVSVVAVFPEERDGRDGADEEKDAFARP